MVLMYIYAYENKINGKIYIGQTVNLKDRDSGHKFVVKKVGIDAAIKKYNRENFDLFIIQMAYSYEEADELEIFWIAEMRKFLGRINVYNIADGGYGTRGAYDLLSPEVKQKIANAALKGKNHPKFGKPTPSDVRAKISNSLKGKNLGKKLSPEHCKHIADGKMGSENPNFGKTPKYETIAKMSENTTGENNPKAKLTNKDVIEIKKILQTKKTRKEFHSIAKQYNVSYCTISDINSERTWKNIK